jgi:hypothetical protein
MKRVVLRFSDVLKLIEFISVTGKFDVDTDIDSCSIIGRLTDADIELAVRGYEARVVDGI